MPGKKGCILYAVIEPRLSDEQRDLRNLARALAREELVPAVARLTRDGFSDPWSGLRGVHERLAELGLLGMLVPEEAGGGGASCVDAAIVLEELGAADVGYAASYAGQTMTLGRLVARHCAPAQREEWLAPFRDGAPVVLAGALSEPDRAGSDLFAPAADSGLGPQTRAQRDGDEWVLQGRKSGFVTNAGVANAYFVMARTRGDAPPAAALSMLRVPSGTDGLSVGARTELAGWRTAVHAELLLDGVRVGGDALVGREHGAGEVFAGTPEVPIGLAGAYVGLARAAHELAASYAEQRKSWGVPIGRHASVALRLGECALDVHSARLAVHDAARAADLEPASATARSSAAKVVAVDAAIRCAERCVQTLGGYGVASEYPAAGMLADAWVGWSCDFTRDLLVMGLAGPASDP